MKHYFGHIQGLRAIAVVSVVLAHLGVSIISGGFVGVDMFFVISGFVITHSLAGRLGKLSFGATLLDFYDRRVRRILPALVVVIVACLAYGYYALPPGDYKSLGDSALASALFVANFYFEANTGYFDAVASSMPLLHIWSLGVEEQFYLFWPVVAMALWATTRFRGPLFWGVLAGLAVLSFVACVWVTPFDMKAAFFLPHYRAWEFLLGVALAVGHARVPITDRTATVFGFVGACLIVASFVLLSEDTLFPGVWALMPAAGTVLLIWSGLNNDWLGKKVLASRPAEFLGDISYSLYLWHWPVIVFYRFRNSGVQLSISEQAVLLFMTIILASASYWGIERPFKDMRVPAARRVISGLAAVAIIASAGGVVSSAQGFPARFPLDVKELASLEVMWTWPCPQSRPIEGLRSEICVLGAPWDKAQKKGLLWGDSHAEHFAPELHDVAKAQNVSLILWRACPPYISKTVKMFRREDPTYQARCENGVGRLLKWISQTPDLKVLVLAGAWAYQPQYLFTEDDTKLDRQRGLQLMKDGFVDLFKKIPKSVEQIVLLGDVPHLDGNPIPCVVSGGCHLDRISSAVAKERHGETDTVLVEAAKMDSRVTVVPMVDRLCQEEECVTYIGNEFLYRDEHHLRRNLSAATRASLIENMGLDQLF